MSKYECPMCGEEARITATFGSGLVQCICECGHGWVDPDPPTAEEVSIPETLLDQELPELE